MSIMTTWIRDDDGTVLQPLAPPPAEYTPATRPEPTALMKNVMIAFRPAPNEPTRFQFCAEGATPGTFEWQDGPIGSPR